MRVPAKWQMDTNSYKKYKVEPKLNSGMGSMTRVRAFPIVAYGLLDAFEWNSMRAT